ncbi:MAG: L,D-transpeptidase family protein [Rhizobiales bacterium]|nr:L,D-transpeptidase family protein [Hyphomicrobiales bacterium]
MAGSFEEQSADTVASRALTSEPAIAPPEQRANPDAYAQLFFLERLFSPSASERQQNSNSPRGRGQPETLIQSRDKDGNQGPTYRVLGAVPNKSKTRRLSQGDSYKLKIAQLLRQAPPVQPTTGPLLLAVSISKQTVTLYDAGVAIATSPVSTGTSSHPTPTGIFSVIEKQWWHRSNLYSAAPMPFMQRITWSGVALHAGDLPGYAASHGCIRLPESFALRLWGTTKIGVRVIVTKDEVTPVEIAHAMLFSPKAKTEPVLEPKPEPELKPEQKTPPENKPQSEVMSMSDNAATTLSLAARQTERATEVAVAPITERTPERIVLQTPSPQPEPSTPVIVRPPSYVGGGPRVIAVPEEVQEQLAAANPVSDEEDEVADNGIDDETRAALQNLELVDPEHTVINGTAEVTIRRPGQPAETLLLAVEKMPADTVQPVSEPRVMLASLDESMIPMLSRAMPNGTQLAARRRTHSREPTVEMSALQPHVLRPGPVSVLISRKDQRMYIRKGFEPLFDVPIKIANPRESIGTYLFTAVAPGEDQAKLRWVVLPIETSSSVEQAVAAEARSSDRKRSRAPERIEPKVKILAAANSVLDRLELPQEAVDRISELASVGATLIVTERGLGRRDAAALDSDFTVQFEGPVAKPRPRPQQQTQQQQPQPQRQPTMFFNPLF